MLKVIIRRRSLPGKEEELEKLLVELRCKAMAWPGYISGETLRSLEDPSLFLVLSTWRDAELWHFWGNSRERREISRLIEPMLKAPEAVSLFKFVWQPSPCDAALDQLWAVDLRLAAQDSA